MSENPENKKEPATNDAGSTENKATDDSNTILAQLVEILGASTKSKSKTSDDVDPGKKEPSVDIRKEIRDSIRIERALVDVPPELVPIVEAAVDGKPIDEALKIVKMIKSLDVKKKEPATAPEAKTGGTEYRGMFSKDYKPAWQKELDKKNGMFQ